MWFRLTPVSYTHLDVYKRQVEGHYGIKAFLRTPKGVMLTGDGKELFIEFKGILNRLYHLDLKYEDKKESNHAFYVAAQHHICGMDSFMSIIQLSLIHI